MLMAKRYNVAAGPVGNSLVFLTAKKLLRGYIVFEKRCETHYENRVFYMNASAIRENISGYFKVKFWKQLILKQRNRRLAEGSGIVKNTVPLVRINKKNILKYLDYSKITKIAHSLAKHVHTISFKDTGVIAVSVVIANSVTLAILKRDVNSAGWIMRMAIIFFGIVAISCGAKWQDIATTSFIARFFKKRR
jgi:hypothetical protein